MATSYGAKESFLLQQGFPATAGDVTRRFLALQLQPRLVFLAVTAGIVTQSCWLFWALGSPLAWSAALPRLNPFDALHNALIASRARVPRLGPAPAPRRFAQMLVATLAIWTAWLLHFGYPRAAWFLEAIFLAATAALVFSGFCLGSFLYHLATGNREFALRTLPWSRTRR